MIRTATVGLELALLVLFIACWICFFSGALLGYPLAGLLPIGLYALYGVAAVVGWLLGNVFIHRSAKWAKSTRRRLLLMFLLSPGGLFYLLWSLGTEGQRLAVPFAPLYAFGVFATLFLVPISFRGGYPARGR